MEMIADRNKLYSEITDKCIELYCAEKAYNVDEVLMKLMDIEGIPMHAPIHHYIMPAALLTVAAKIKGKNLETLSRWLNEAMKRGKTVPGGFCGDCGACGSGVGVGIFLSIYTGAKPTKRENWDVVNRGTAYALLRVSSYPGPRCCKRVLLLAAQAACEFVKEELKMAMNVSKEIRCHYRQNNAECIGVECPFFNK